MNEPANKGKRQRVMTLLILLEGVVLALYGFHVISKTWTVALFFFLIIPVATLKAFADYRSR